MGAVRAGDVHLVHPGVARQVGAGLGVAVGHREVAVLDGRGEDLLEEGAQVLVDRVDLEQRHRALDEHLLQRVLGRDGGDVAGPEHQRHPAVVGALVEGRLALADLLRGQVLLEVDLRGDAGEGERLQRRARVDLERVAAALAPAQPARVELRAAADLDVGEALLEQPQVPGDRQAVREPLLPGVLGLGVQALGQAGRLDHPVQPLEVAVGDLGEEREPLGDVQPREAAGRALQPVEHAVEPRARRGLDVLKGQRGLHGGTSGALTLPCAT
jgi:hypothetical protein